MTQPKIPPEIYYQNLPKRYLASAVMIFNEKDELLVVKPSYKEDWLLPGGITDQDETALQTAIREIKEEIGLTLNIKAMRCVDMKPGGGGLSASVQSIFETEPLSSVQIANIQLDNNEIIEFAFLPVNEAVKILIAPLAQRTRQALLARQLNTCFYLENGQNPFGKAV